MKKTFLLIDDDADDRMLFCLAMEELDDVGCITFSNGCTALHQVLQQEIAIPDLFFIDINMPGRNGWYYLNKIKNDERLKNIPVIIYSTAFSDSDVETAVALGAVFLFGKPGDCDEMTESLKIVYDHYIEGKINSLGDKGFPWFHGSCL